MFRIEPSSGVPIYRQIMDQITRLIISGGLKPGDELPSVRQASADLEVNQMTISKAYSLLEAKGLLERHRGRPMMVAEREQESRGAEERLELIRPILEEVVAQARQLALAPEVLLKELTRLLEE